MPLSAGYLLRAAKMAIPYVDGSRNLHGSGWVLSVAVTIAGIAAMFAHLGEHDLTSLPGSVLLAVR